MELHTKKLRNIDWRKKSGAAMRCRVVCPYIIPLVLTIALPIEADSLLDEITWKRTKQEFERFNDWSLGVRRIPKGAKPEIIVSDGEIKYNGEVLKIGHSLQDWKRVLGSSTRPAFHGRVLIWDDIGIKVALYPSDETKVRTLIVDFSCKERMHGSDCARNGGRGHDYDPKNYFTGYLEVDGGAIDNESTVDDVDKLITGRGRYGRGCGTELCLGYAVGDGRFLSFVDVDSRRFKSVIYNVSFTGGNRGLYEPPVEVSENTSSSAHLENHPSAPQVQP